MQFTWHQRRSHTVNVSWNLEHVYVFSIGQHLQTLILPLDLTYSRVHLYCDPGCPICNPKPFDFRHMLTAGVTDVCSLDVRI